MDAVTVDEGIGTPILVVHGGTGNVDSWKAVTDRLRSRFRTVRLLRRQYRLDLPGGVGMADEVEHVRQVAATLDRPVLVGHSSGAVVALETLVAEPGTFSAAVLYEPPLQIGDVPLGGEAQQRARAAADAGELGKAFRIHLRDVVEESPALAWGASLLSARDPEMRALISRQIDDNDALDALGSRLDAYSRITVPTLLIGGDRSPQHLTERLDALEQAMPNTRRLLMHGQGHLAQVRAPDRLAAAITQHIDLTVSRQPTS
jgi:pimeloyl-ACP methyl ester carboxylesterase